MANANHSRVRIVAGACLVLGLALGFCAARLLHRPDNTGAVVATKNDEVTEAKRHPAVEAHPVTATEAAPAESTPSVPAIQQLRKLASVKPLDLETALRLVRKLSVAECREAMGLFQRSGSEERAVLLRAIARRWAGLDAENAFAESMNSPEARYSRILLEEAARELIHGDAEAALAKLRNLSTQRRITLGHFMLTSLAETNPARAAAFLSANKEFAADNDIFGTVANMWARNDPRAALQWADALPKSRAQAEALRGVWASWSSQDPAAAAADLSSRPAGAVEGRLFGTVTEAWSRTDPRAALAWIASLPEGQQGEAWNGFSIDVKQQGVETTLELIKAIKSSAQQKRLIAGVTSQLAADDPAAAIAWAERFPAGELRNQALTPALDRWSRSDPVQALAYITQLQAGDTRSRALRRAVSEWVEQDLEAAKAWAQQLAAGKERDMVVAEAARRLREVEPAKATEWLALIQSSETRRRFVGDLAGRWTESDPAAAVRWLEQLPDSNSHVEGHYALARQWAFRDSDATANWISSLPSGATRDAAIGAFVETVDGSNPALATTWATAIEDTKARNKNVQSAFRRWVDRDANQAKTWLNSAKLDDSLRAELAKTAAGR